MSLVKHHWRRSRDWCNAVGPASVLGVGAVCAAGFEHSTFTGLVTLGAALLVADWSAGSGR